MNKTTNFKKWTEDEFKEQIRSNKISSSGIVYSDKMLWDFFNYWSEPNPKGKMRFQLEVTWETSRRLRRWYDNNYSNNATKTKSSPTGYTDKRADRNSAAQSILGLQ